MSLNNDDFLCIKSRSFCNWRYRSKTDSRIVGVVLCAAELLLFVLPINLAAYLPHFFFGAVLVFIAIDLLLDWLIRSRHKVSSAEYCELQSKCQLFPNFLFKTQKEWRIAPDKRSFCIDSWPLILQFEVCDRLGDLPGNFFRRTAGRHGNWSRHLDCSVRAFVRTRSEVTASVQRLKCDERLQLAE